MSTDPGRDPQGDSRARAAIDDMETLKRDLGHQSLRIERRFRAIEKRLDARKARQLPTPTGGLAEIFTGPIPRASRAFGLSDAPPPCPICGKPATVPIDDGSGLPWLPQCPTHAARTAALWIAADAEWRLLVRLGIV